MLKCKACGADIPFVPETQNYICPYCGTEHTHADLTEAEKAGEIKAEEQKHADGRYMEVVYYTCPQCGGELYTTEDTAATFCSYCGASVLLEKRVSKELKPEYIIPFKITKEQAADSFKKKTSKAIFAPGYIRHLDIEKIRGIYMPYWTYTVRGNGRLAGIGKREYMAPGGRWVETYELDGTAGVYGDGIEYDAASKFPDDLSARIAPFDFKEKHPFAASYMSGFYADTGDISPTDHAKEATDMIKSITGEHLQDRYGLNDERMLDYPELNTYADRAMYPVWFISAREKDSGKVSYGVVNGQSGKIAADLPVHPGKLLLGTAIAAIPIFLLLAFLISPTPTPWITNLLVLILSAMGLITSLGAASGQGMSIFERYIWVIPVAVVWALIITGSNGFGGNSKTMILFLDVFPLSMIVIATAIPPLVKSFRRENDSVEKMRRKMVPSFVINAVSILICLVTAIVRPVDDFWYYGAIMLTCILNALSYMNLFRIRNKITKRTLPQLGKRGGDEL